MKILAVFISIIGLFGLVRSLRILLTMVVLEKKQKIMLLIGLFGSHFILNILFLRHFFVIVPINLVFFLMAPLFLQLKEFITWRDYEENMLGVLDLIVVRLSTGASLKQSLQQISVPKCHIQHLISELSHFINTKSALKVSNNRRQTEKIALELQKIDQEGFKTIERVRALRYQLRTERQFKQKIMQATLQVRLQSSLLLLLYIGLALFSLIHFGWGNMQGWFALSLLLFLLGLLVNWQISRGFKWQQ